jgi:hypothetical protein
MYVCVRGLSSQESRRSCICVLRVIEESRWSCICVLGVIEPGEQAVMYLCVKGYRGE